MFNVDDNVDCVNTVIQLTLIKAIVKHKHRAQVKSLINQTGKKLQLLLSPLRFNESS